MPIKEPLVKPPEVAPEPIELPEVETEVEAREETEAKRQPPYAVILHNDNINGFDFVVGVLKKVFHYGSLKAIWLTTKAHFTGQSIVWSGALEVAELKADQIRSCGPDPRMKEKGAVPLTVTVEPLPQ